MAALIKLLRITHYLGIYSEVYVNSIKSQANDRIIPSLCK